MKIKPKKNKSSFDIKQFLILHGEKFVVGLLVLFAIFFIYAGISSFTPLAWQPADLDKISQTSRTFIDANTRTATDEGITVFQYDKYAEWIKYGVKLSLYETNTVWLPLLFPERIKRDKVPLLPVESLQASAGLGAISIKPTGGKTQIGERWAVVTGLIPIQRQRELYVRAYAASIRPIPERDTPLYVSYNLERAEIVPDQDDINLKWEEIKAFEEINKRVTNTWNGVAPEPVDSDFLAPYVYVGAGSLPMACPLPPTLKPFGSEVTQSSIPLISETAAEYLKKSQEYNKKLQEEIERNPAGSAGDYRSISPFDNTNRQQDNPTSRQPNENILSEEQRTISHFLFRYLDYSVQPGKTYRYRVKLSLANPNYGLPESDVMDISLTEAIYLDTDVSNASNKVTIPPDSRVLARSVSPSSRNSPWTEPYATILAVYFELSDGSEWVWGTTGERVYRGSTVNIKNAPTYSPLAIDRPETKPRPAGGARPTNPNDPQSQSRDVITNVCVLDMNGGVALGKVVNEAPTIKTPEKILVVNNMGEIAIHEVNKDNKEIDAMKAVKTNPNNPNNPTIPPRR
ncbi:MAG: hypothetical protein LBH59_11760 [Planctomycetaceae bacterium]|jgi:hypothetical protein|nr:hypothetical protein [Planctomycetaceae bacterium]